jgi:heptaprenylglyceryl phosphate synthase
VKQHTEAPLIVGGGIRTPEAALAAVNAGADVIVIGNAVEKNKNLVKEITEAVKASVLQA